MCSVAYNKFPNSLHRQVPFRIEGGTGEGMGGNDAFIWEWIKLLFKTKNIAASGATLACNMSTRHKK